MNILGLPHDASEWTLDLWRAIQFFDDLVDEADIQRESFDQMLWGVLVGMPSNPFFVRHANTLLPVMAQAILKWQASDRAERNGQHDAKSFVWRASFYDVLLTVCQLCFGAKWAIDHADKVLSLYGESFETYMQEFGPCRIQ